MLHHKSPGVYDEAYGLGARLVPALLLGKKLSGFSLLQVFHILSLSPSSYPSGLDRACLESCSAVLKQVISQVTGLCACGKARGLKV